MNKFNNIKAKVLNARDSAYTKAALGLTTVALVAGEAGAAGEWDIAGAQTTVTSLLGVGAATAVFVIIYRVVKGAGNKV